MKTRIDSKLSQIRKSKQKSIHKLWNVQKKSIQLVTHAIHVQPQITGLPVSARAANFGVLHKITGTLIMYLFKKKIFTIVTQHILFT